MPLNMKMTAAISSLLLSASISHAQPNFICDAMEESKLFNPTKLLRAYYINALDGCVGNPLNSKEDDASLEAYVTVWDGAPKEYEKLKQEASQYPSFKSQAAAATVDCKKGELFTVSETNDTTATLLYTCSNRYIWVTGTKALAGKVPDIAKRIAAVRMPIKDK
jgi:hypothetical protein